MSRRNVSPEEAAAARAQRIEAAQAVLADAVAGIRDGDDWKGFLGFQSKLHAYSANNCLLLTSQYARKYEQGLVATPLPTYVASYRRWRELGRQVERGQSGMAIIAPMRGVRREAVDAEGNTRRLGKDDQAAPGEQETKTSFMRGFTVEKVFALEQTTGEPLPEPPRPKLLEGQAPAGLGEAVMRLIESHGFTVATVANAGLIGGANGLTAWRERTVTVRADMDDAAMVRTLLHEAGHVLLHSPDDDSTPPGMPRSRMEVEAESVAFVVAHAHGMDAGEYSFPYVVSWAGPEPDEVVAKTATRVARVAKQIIAASPAEHTDGGRPVLPARQIAEAVEPEQVNREAVGV